MRCYHELLHHRNRTTDTGLMGLMPYDHSPDLKSKIKVIQLAPDLTNCGLSHVQETLVLKSTNEGGCKTPRFNS